MSPAAEPRRKGEQRRGAELRRHILFEAKEVFLETGYERASMDAVAARAGTSKRSLYAHFESKDKLFLAILDLIRELHQGNLKTPDAYADDRVEAVARYCGRFLQLMVWDRQVRTCRLGITEAERLPVSARSYFDAMFTGTRDRLAAYLAERCDMDEPRATAVARELIDRAVLPRLFRTLLGVEEPIEVMPQEETLAGDVDLDAIRRLVSAVL